MKIGLQLAALVFLASTACLATGNFSGYMVDSNCYESTQRNTNQWPTPTVELDMNWDIKFCAPKTTTKSFGLVQQDWKIFRFDSGGNAKAAELVRNTEKQEVYLVALAGAMDKNILRVDSISMAK
jgi:hypothetical protein